jgi:hypothetical protein
MSSSSSKKKRSSRSSQGSLSNTGELVIVRPETDSSLSSVSSFPSMLGSDSSVESNSSGLQNTAALLRASPPPRSSSDSISAATYRGLSSSSSSRSRRRGRGRAGPASKKIMFRINPQVGPTVYGVPRIAPPPPPRTRRVRMVAPKRNSSSSSSSSWSSGSAVPASSRIMFRINPRAGPTVYGVPRIAPPPPPPRTRGVRMVAPKRNSSLERRRRAEWREFRGNLRDKFGVTFPSRSSSSSSSSVSRRRSPSRSRTPSPK